MTLKDYNIIIRDSLDFALQEYNLTWMQPVPFSINSAHFSLFKPELYLLFNVITVLMASVYLRKFFHPSDVTVVVYFKTITMLCTTSIYIFHNLFIINSSIIFNFALVIDYYTTVAKLLILISSVIILISSHKHVFSSYTDTVEYSIVVSFSIFFLLILISGYSMITVYMSLEGLSLMLYVLAAFPFNRSSLEAAIKYFIVGSFSSGLILFGIICMYGTTGTFDFLWLKVILETQGLVGLTTFRWLGLCSLLFGFLFKLGAFPCHMWAIDVYEGT
jgi:NADH-quinone oxidoreductase subunit N